MKLHCQTSDIIVWLMNHIELPLARLCGHGDVKIYKKQELSGYGEKSRIYGSDSQCGEKDAVSSDCRKIGLTIYM